MDRLRTAAGRGRARPRPLLLLAAALAVGLGAASIAASAPPARLADGSPPARVPPALAAFAGRLVVSTVAVRPLAALGATARACFLAAVRELTPDALVVDRVGVHGRSLTAESRAGDALRGCGTSFGPPVRGNRWCARAGAPLRSALVPDPRLSLCSDRRRREVGFAWLNPLRRARWVMVEQPGLWEAYRVVLGLPVRVAVPARRVRGGGVVIRFVQLDAAGHELERRAVEARIAG